METLLACIQNESTSMVDLVEVLQEEQAALIQAPTLELMEKIKQITQRKSRLVMAITEIGKLRYDEMFRLGFKAEESKVPDWLQNNDQADCWAKLIDRTAKAKELNRVNGLLLAIHVTRNQSTLGILCKNDTNPSLYGANGQSNTQRTAARSVVA